MNTDKLLEGLKCCVADTEDVCQLGQCPYFNNFNGCQLDMKTDAINFIEKEKEFRRQMFNRCAAMTHCDSCELCVWFDDCEKERTLNPL